MQVLTNILQQGTEFEGLGENVLSDRYSKLVDVSGNEIFATMESIPSDFINF
jgi:hypothetical protein